MQEVTFHSHKNERNVWFIDGQNTPLQMVSHEVSHKIKIYFLKNRSKSILQSQIFFHKDTLIYWQAILDTVCIYLSQER